ncbi:MAG: hypothetical protein HY316_10255 [Acidobacteria bacterium]|nr:hypothetical protein [Acidobacteriota bacterium]
MIGTRLFQKMAADNKLELVIQVDAAGANASIKSANKRVSDLEKEAVSSAKRASNGIDGMTASRTKSIVAGNAIYDVAKRTLAARCQPQNGSRVRTTASTPTESAGTCYWYQ